MQKIVVKIVLIMVSIGLVTAQDTLSPELQTQLDEIEAATSSIRELDRIETTDLSFPTKADLEVYLREEFDAEFAPDEFADDLLFYVGLDLLEPDIDIETILFDFLLSQIAGYYNPEDQSMNVILMSGNHPEDNLPLLESIFYSHEYVHALQDQHFDLETLTNIIDESDNGDFQLAVLALMEGDASLVMTEYITALAEKDPLALAKAMLDAGGDIPDSVPAVISDELLFPYFQGQFFVMDILNEQGWNGINEAFNNNLPQSTEQIYHPDRYLTGDMPIVVNIPDMSNLLGDNWRMAQDTPVGEFYLRQHLKTQFRMGVVREMTTGWGGDRIKLYVDDATGDIIWVLYQVWDTPEDATEFAEGYVEFLDLRFATASDDGVCWSGEDTMCFMQIDDDETRISFAMQSDLAMPLLMVDS